MANDAFERIVQKIEEKDIFNYTISTILKIDSKEHSLHYLLLKLIYYLIYTSNELYQMFAREDNLFILIIKNLSGSDFPNVMKGGFKPGKIKLDSKINEREYPQTISNNNNNLGAMENNPLPSTNKSEFAKSHNNQDRAKKPNDGKNPTGQDFSTNAQDNLVNNNNNASNVNAADDTLGGKNELHRDESAGGEGKIMFSGEVNNEYEPKIRAVSLMILQLFSSRKKNYKLFLTIRGLDNLLPY